MKGITYTSTSTASSAPAIKEEEEWYVKVASRFFRAKRRGGEDGGGPMIQLHYLDVCFLCKRHISRNRDIFMYKGDAAFCSEECRQEQMDMDEALETVACRQRLLQKPSPPAPASCMANKAAAEDVEGVRRREAAASRSQMMHRRTTIANLAARTPVVAS